MQRYGAYKDSCVEWIGVIPEEWSAMKLGYCLTLNQGGVWGSDPEGETGTIVMRSTEQTVDGKWCIENPAIRNLENEPNVEERFLAVGDLLVTKSSGSESHIGKTTIVDERVSSLRCAYSNFMQRLRTNERLSPRFCWYVLNSNIARLQYCYLQNSTSGLGNLNADVIADICIPVPPETSQQIIVDYLDARTAEIDALVADCEREVGLLREYRKAVISEVVTKGLDPNAPMKDSCVEWIGEIPKEWGAFRMGSLYREVSETGYPDLPILSVSIHSGISDRELSDDEVEKVINRSEDRSLYKRVKKNDLAYNMMRAWQGAIGASRVDGVVSPAYTVLRPMRPDIALTPYIEYLLRTTSAIEELRRRSYGITDFRLRLYWQYFKDMTIYLPSLDKQAAVVSYLDAKTSEIDELVEAKLTMADKLREYRKSLISEAVTGKFRVPGA